MAGVFSKQLLDDVRLSFTEGLSDEEAAWPHRRRIISIHQSLVGDHTSLVIIQA